MKNFFLFLSLLVLSATDVFSQQKIVYKFDIKEEIAPPVWRQTQTAFKQAEEAKADYVIIHMNTFGGALDAADNIRTKILECKKPVFVFIDKNAASAGALISIACDSIYMAPGASIGAATVVDQQGTPLPEKYQSYMRSILRSTAEVNHRDPKIAEAMNDPRIKIEGVNDSGKVLSFTPSEAVKNNYCEGEVTSIEQALKLAGIKDYKLIEYKRTMVEEFIDWLLNPAVSGVLIMIIIGGIYFELQSPGIGLPLFAAIGAAILYFAPHYLEGLAQHWEILLFIVGIILLLIEIFAIPGFGVIGITGIICIVLGLSLSLVGAIPDGSTINLPDGKQFTNALGVVMVSLIISLVLSVYLGTKFLKSKMFSKHILHTTQQSSNGYVSSMPLKEMNSLIGQIGIANTVLRPSGKVEIGGEIYDAVATIGFIEKGESIKVIKHESSQLFVAKNSL